MKLKLVSLTLSLTSIFLSSCNNGSTATTINNNTTYLAKPSGPYGVGFKDYHYINTAICPDPNYIPNVNESNFSPGNQGGSGTNFCHEIMARIYYPINSTITSTTTPYYPPRVLQLQDSLDGAPGITESQIATLPATLWSWSESQMSITNNKLPVILFSPGAETPAQGYEDYIT